MNTTSQRTIIVLVGFIFAFITHAPSTVQAYDTENLILVSIDGIRDLEAFSCEFPPQDDNHPYIPFIYDQLKPQGTAYTEMYNIFCTITSPGHASMLTGNWEIFPNYNIDHYHTRSWSPTIFEYARKELNLSRSDTWCVVGKLNCVENNWSLHPEYGEDFGANLIKYPDGYKYETDSLTTDKALEIMEADHPSLLFVNLQDVDTAGHSGIYELYLAAIRKADRAVQRFWNRIQEDPFYSGKTTLMVTTDHGRHSPGYGGFQNHGGMCHGCKHVMFLAVGPDTPADQEISRRVYQIDIAPTIGELMGFSTPYSRGQVLEEAIRGYQKSQRHIMKDPAIDIDDGDIFLTWTDNRTGIDQIYFTASTNGGESWSDTIQVSDTAVATTHPGIAADESGVHVVWLDYEFTEKADTEIWRLYYRRSEDLGLTWEPKKLLFSSIVENEKGHGDVTLSEPTIRAEQGSILIAASGFPDAMGVIVSNDGGDTWKLVPIYMNRVHVRTVVPCPLDREWGIVWCDQTFDNEARNWDIFWQGSDSGGYEWPNYKRLREDPAYSIQPDIDSDGQSGMVVAWADNASGKFQILFRRKSFLWWWYSEQTISESSSGAWQPIVAWDRDNFEVNLVWTDYRNGRGELYHRRYNLFSWTDEVRLTSAEGSVYNPKLAFDDNGHYFMVWEEITDSEVRLGTGSMLP
jgi:hypothetical protein